MDAIAKKGRKGLSGQTSGPEEKSGARAALNSINTLLDHQGCSSSLLCIGFTPAHCHL